MADKIQITKNIAIEEGELTMSAVRSQGAGGQNVNKVATAIHLKFDIGASSLPAPVKERLLQLRDRRISRDGVVVIKAQGQRSQEQNRREALERLKTLIARAVAKPAVRKPTRPTKSSQQKRVQQKLRRSRIKAFRQRVSREDSQ